MIPDLPHSIEAEQAVLGGVLVNAQASAGLDALAAVADILTAEHFYLAKHMQIWGAMLSCWQQQSIPDIRTLCEELRRRGQLDAVGGLAYVGNLYGMSSQVERFARIVVNLAARRRLITAASQIAAMAYDETMEFDMVLTHAQALVDGSSPSLADPRYRPFSAADLDREELPPLAWAIPGILPQGLTLLVGRPKMRKSWMALAFAIAIASGGKALGSIDVAAGDVLYLALEDGKRRLQTRQRKILSGSSAPRRLEYLTTAPRLDAGCVALVDDWVRRHPAARLVIVDVLAKVRPQSTGRGNMYDEDYAALEPLQQLAERRQVAILVVHHMRKADAEDIMDLVSGSAGVGGSADGLLLLDYPRGQDTAKLHVTGRDVDEPQTYAVQWDNPTVQWLLLGNAEEVQTTAERQEIIQVFRDERRTLGPRDVADLLCKESEYTRIKQLMYRMTRDGELHLVGRGQYCLPDLQLVAMGDMFAEQSNAK